MQIGLLLPEITLLLSLLGVLLAETSYHGERVRLVSLITLIGLMTAGIQILLTSHHIPVRAFGQSLTFDGVSFYFRLFFVVLALLCTVMAVFSKELDAQRRPEFYVFLLGGTLGLCLLSAASDLLVIVLCLGLLGLVAAFQAGYAKQQSVSTEAAIKLYVFFGISICFILFAGAFYFGHAQTLNLYGIRQALERLPMAPRVELGALALLLLGFFGTIGAFPLQLWLPDVTQGAPTPASSYLMIALPAAAFAVLIRFALTVLAGPSLQGLPFSWVELVSITSGLTMAIGALMAFRQESVKRMMAFLMMGQLGFSLMGLLVLDATTLSGLLYRLLVQLFSWVGMGAALSFLVDRLESDTLKDLRGVLGRAVPECLCLLLFLGCFLGLPPFPGFLGKFVLLGVMMREQHYGLLAVAILSEVLMLAAFARLSFALAGGFHSIQKTGVLGALIPAKGQRAFVLSLLAPIVLLAVFAERVIFWTGPALLRIFW